MVKHAHCALHSQGCIAEPGVALARTPSTEVVPDKVNFLESFLEVPTSQELIRFLCIGHVKNL